MNIAQKNPQHVFVGRGIRTVATYGSAAGQVAVHEVIGHYDQYRFFVSLEGKTTKNVALNYWHGSFMAGNRKSDATREAKTIVEKTAALSDRLDCAQRSTLKGADILVRDAQAAWDRYVGRYCAEVA